MAQISYMYTGLFPRKLDIPENALTVKEMSRINPDPFIKKFMGTIFTRNSHSSKEVSVITIMLKDSPYLSYSCFGIQIRTKMGKF